MRRLPLCLVSLLTATSLTGCATGERADGVQVVAGFYALEYVAERVGGDQVDVTSLTRPGQEPHSADLSVEQTAQVADADVVVHLSGFQPVVDDAVAEVASGSVVDAAAAADLVPTAALGSDDAPDSGGDAVDPHFWLDPVRVSAVATQVAEALSTADPDQAQTYRANLRELQQELSALDGRLRRGLASCRRDVVVVSHDAFGYLGERYGLEMAPIAGLSPDAEPSPRHLRELQDLITTKGITTVFSERLASAQMAETLSADLGLETAVLDPVEGLSDETANEDYVSLMDANLQALRKANGCR